MEPQIRQHPLDVTKLTKGQTLAIAELEPILGLKYPDERWGFRLMRLRAKIEMLRNRLDLPVITLRSRHGELLVCDDADASQYNRAMGRRGIKRFRRAAARNIAVDVSQLPEEDQQTHERTLRRQAMMLIAIRKASHAKQIAGPSQRTTPPMVCAPVAEPAVVTQ